MYDCNEEVYYTTNLIAVRWANMMNDERWNDLIPMKVWERSTSKGRIIFVQIARYFLFQDQDMNAI